jgi:hypothetical protein
MSGWSLVAFIVGVPLGLVAGLAGGANLALAGLWLASGKESPSRIPLLGSASGVLLIALSMLMQAGWPRTSAVLIGALGLLGESATILAGAFIAMRRRRRSERAD